MRTIAFLSALLLIAGVLVLPSSADGILPAVSAKSAVLLDASDGRILFEKNAVCRMSMASTTKIMTALVALESASLDSVITIPSAAVGVEGSSIYLTVGEKLTLRELLYAVMLSSANDAATAVAIAVGGSVEGFANKMNAAAARLGLADTRFVNPHGLDADGHYTTALDLARLTAYALNVPEFRDIVSTYKHEIAGPSGKRLLFNHNKLLKNYDGCIGVKTGYTKKTGRCLVSAAERDGLTLVAVTLAAPDDWRDHKAMLDYGFEFYDRVFLATAGQELATMPAVGGATVSLRAETDLCVTLTHYGDEITVKTEATTRFLWSTPPPNTYIATAVFYRGEKRLGEVRLVS